MKRLLAGMLALLFLILVVFAGGPDKGSIYGHVRDAAGVPVIGALVVATHVTTHAEHRSRSAGNGCFSLMDIPVGLYSVQASYRDMRSAKSEARVLKDQTTTVELELDKAVSSTNMAVPGILVPPPPPPSAAQPDALSAPSGAYFDMGIEGGVSGGVVGGVVGGLGYAPRPMCCLIGSASDFNTEAYDRIDEIGFRDTAKHPLSTFSVDVDTASYANTRRFINQGKLPPRDAVRIEEFVNYFDYDYPQPQEDAPFSITTEVGACPWNAGHKLALIGLAGRRIAPGQRPSHNLVFLLDVSGSMDEPRKLPLLKAAMKMLARHLDERDYVAIVVYAGASGLVLPRTRGDHRNEILDALDRLQAGGSTHGSAGIQLAYETAEAGLVQHGVNRVILATDGDFNVGVTDVGALTRLIEEKRRSGIFLSVLGFGEGNLKDATMEKLADRGNGNYSYIDSLHEARKVLVSEAGGTLVTIAKDVKIQVEFNPARVGAYRLVGYENRMLRDEDFNDDTKDAGEIGAGHRVTALYEIAPPGSKTEPVSIDPLKYQAPAERTAEAESRELLTVKLRYKDPDGDESRLLSRIVEDIETAAEPPSDNFGFAAAVAEFAMLLRDSDHKAGASYAQALDLARRHRGSDDNGYRAEMIKLAELARELNSAREAKQ